MRGDERCKLRRLRCVSDTRRPVTSRQRDLWAFWCEEIGNSDIFTGLSWPERKPSGFRDRSVLSTSRLQKGKADEQRVSQEGQSQLDWGSGQRTNLTLNPDMDTISPPPPMAARAQKKKIEVKLQSQKS